MFTGIIEDLGTVSRVADSGLIKCLTIKSGKIYRDLKQGDSVAVNGVCLTLTSMDKDMMSFDVMKATLAGTTLGALGPGDIVNLERALRVGDRVSGHFVYGHVDGTREISGISMKEGAAYVDISLEKSDRVYLAEKGSIAVDGISLTIGEITGKGIRINLIPHTIKNTVLFKKKPRDRVNIEFDIVMKSKSAMAPDPGRSAGVSWDLLKDTGFSG